MGRRWTWRIEIHREPCGEYPSLMALGNVPTETRIIAR